MSYNRSGSPYNDRISRISEKLNGLQINAETEKQSKMDQAENNVKYLEDQFEEFQDAMNKKYNALKENMFKIQKIMDEDKNNREHILEMKMKEILSLDQKFSQVIESEILSRKDGENRLLRQLEDKFNLIKSEIGRESKLRAESIDQLNQCLEADLPKLNEEIKTESVDRDENDQSIMRKITEELTRLNNTVQVEKKNREESEQAIFDMLRDVVNRVKSEIDFERKNREGTEETLLNLLEDTCNKINTATNNKE